MKNFIKFLFPVLFLFIVIKTQAVPAYPLPIEIIQPDGSKITIILKGDEKVRWAETTDGYSILYNDKGIYEYAKLDSRQYMVPSGVKAKNKEQRNREDFDFLANIPKGLVYSSEQIQIFKSYWEIQKSEAQNAFPTTGTRNLVCILIGFTDKAFTKTQADFNNLFNQINYTTDGATGSVKDYYLECSYGQLTLNVTVAGPFTASNTMAYYGANDIYGNDVRPRELCAEAINLADPTVNFANFDNDNDGYVDGVYMIYAGYGEEAGGGADAIWAHAWNLSSTLYKDGKYLSKYSCSPELRGASGTGITRIGVICHEFGHVLGAPDFYDTDYSTNGQYDGTGYWDMMSSGSWNNNGATPAHHNAYTKTIVYNWATPTLLSSGTIITLLNAEENSNSFYRYNTTTNNEYFIIENRQQHKFDAYIPGKGMIIYHVDGNYISTAGNAINAGSHQGMYPVCANATGNPPTTYGTINSTGCPFPGSSNKTSFTDTTTPWAKSWAGANTSKPITSITENTTNKTVTFTFMGGSSCTQPTTQASNLTFTNLTSNSVTLNWTRGSGNGLLILAKSDSSVDSEPVSGTTYTANSNFGSGSQIGTGNYVIYNGTATSMILSGLSIGKTYYFALYEYATTGTCYKTPALTGYVTIPCTTITEFPYTENFNATSIPSCWLQQNVGTGLTDRWAISATNMAGGSANEMKASWTSASPATSRLIMPAFNTLNTDTLKLTFNHYYDDYGAGLTMKIQSSNDMVTWTDVGWSFISGNGNIGPATVTVPITTNLKNSTTYIAFVLDGNLYYFDYWYIDNIVVNRVLGQISTLAVSTNSLPSFGNVYQNQNSFHQSFRVAGTGLTSNVNITAPAGFQVSTSCKTGYSSSVSLTPVMGTLASTRIYVRYSPSTIGSSSSNITVSSSGANNQSVSVSGTCISSGIPANYYSTASGNGALLKTQLHNIIKTHNRRSYTQLWTDYQTTDKKFNGKVWDMYSDRPCDSSLYEYTFVTNQCGTYTQEGNCYNREHTIPDSWWGGSTTDSMYTDLFNVIPTDGYVNGQRGNYTFGTVGSASYTSTNGSKRGSCNYPGYNGVQGIVFEPIDEYKGDFARIFFYMITRYESRIPQWATFANAADALDGSKYPGFKPWQLNLLLEWHNNDPVDQKEINRNNAVYSIQGNRNPFVDNPQYVSLIWQSKPVVSTSAAGNIMAFNVTCNGTIQSPGSSSVTESGFVYSTNPNPTIGGQGVTKVVTNPTVGNGNFSVTISNLNPITTYYVKAFATNSFGTTYGNEVFFTTDNALAVITTDSVNEITGNSAKINCNIVSNLYSPLQFTGVVYSTSPNPFAGNPGVTTASTNPSDTTGYYSVVISNLSPSTTYYVKAYASNLYGVSYGDQLTFTTNNCIVLNTPNIQNFETTFPPTGWSVINPDNGKTWQNKYVGGSKPGDSAAYINFYSYSTKGQIDDLISPTYNLVNATNPKLNFKVAYRYYSTTSTDSLKIFYSTDCGNTYNPVPIYQKGGVELSTGSLLTSSFVPTTSSDWRDEVISLQPFIGSNIKFKFQAVNNYGNNLYIDDITVTGDGNLPPVVSTLPANVLSVDSAIIYGSVKANGLQTTVKFQWGLTTNYTDSALAIPSVISGDTTIILYRYLSGLQQNTTYNYRIVATNSFGTTYGNNMTFKTPCQPYNLPITENFNSTSFPNCWTTQNSSGVMDKWTVSLTNLAGGAANEMKLTYQSWNGTTRLVSPKFNTQGIALIRLSFKQFYDDFSTDCTLKVQSSTDAINWYDENFEIVSGNGNIGPSNHSVVIPNSSNAPYMYIAFTATGNLGNIDYWYIDDINLEESVPIADFIYNKMYVCSSDSVLFTNTSSGNINSYYWNFGQGANPATANTVGPHFVKYSTPGLKTVSLTVNGQYTTTKQNIINVFSMPAGGYISGNNTEICLGSNTGTLTLNNYTGNIIKWQKRYNNGNWTDINSTAVSISDTPDNTGIWDYRAIVGNTSCENVFSDLYTITVLQPTAGGNSFAVPNEICANTSTVLQLTNYSGNIQWQQSINGTSWINVTGGTGENTNNYTTANLISPMYFRALLSNGVCSVSYSNTTYVNVLPSPNTGSVSTTNSNICSGTSTSVSISGQTGSIQWEQSNDSINWINVIGGSGSTSSTYVTPNLTQTTYYRVKLSINNCFSYSQTVKINVYPNAVGGTISNSGSPICGGNTSVITLTNYVGSVQWLHSPTGTGNWTEVTSGNGINSDVYTTYPLTNFTSLNKTYYFRAKVTSGNCPVVYSPITNIVTFPQNAGGTASATDNICAGSQTTVNLSGYNGNIQWEQTTDTNTTWVNAIGGSGSNTANYTTPSLTTSIFYRAKLSNNQCPSSYSNIVHIKVSDSTVNGNVRLLNDVICQGSKAELSIENHTGSVQWQQSNDGINNWNDVLSGTGYQSSNFITENLYQNTYFRAKITNGACPSLYSSVLAVTTDTMPLPGNISPLTQNICSGNQANILLSNYFGNIQWQNSSDGINGWTDVINGIGINSNSFLTGILNTTTYFRAKLSNGVCPDTFTNAAVVNVEPTPISGTAVASNTQFCQTGSTSISLTGNTGLIQWEESNDEITWNNVQGGSGANSSVYTTPVLTQTKYYRARLTLNNCSSYSNTVVINIYPASVAGTVTVTGTPTCQGNTAQLNLTNNIGNIQWLQSTTGTGNWTEVNTGSGFNSNTFITPQLNSTMYYRARVTSGTCQAVFSNIGSVMVYAMPDGGIATANPQNICTGNSTSIALTNYTGNIVWEQSADSNTWAAATGGTGLYSAVYNTPVLTSDRYYRARLTNPTCPTKYSNAVKIQISSQSIAGYVISSADTICEGNSATLSLNNNTGTIQWQQSIDGVTDWSDIITGSGYNSNIFTSESLSQSKYFRAKVTNGSCPSVYSTPKYIKVDNAPSGGNIVTSDSIICADNSVSLTLNNYFGNIRWQTSSDNGITWNNISGANSNTLITGNLNSTLLFRTVVGNGVCNDSYSDTAQIIVVPKSNSGVITGSKTICKDNSTGDLILTGFTGNIIKWQKSHNYGNWTDIIFTDSIYAEIPDSTGIWNYRAVIGNQPCDNQYSEAASIEVIDKPAKGTISSNQSICFGDFTQNITLSGYTGNIVKWQKRHDNNLWTDINISDSIITDYPDLARNWEYRAEITNNYCDNIYSDITTVTVNQLPLANAGSDTTVCKGQKLILSATGGVIYSWSDGILQNVEFTPEMSKLYTVTVTDTNGCTQTDEIFVNVKSKNLQLKVYLEGLFNGIDMNNAMNENGPHWNLSIADSVNIKLVDSNLNIITAQPLGMHIGTSGNSNREIGCELKEKYYIVVNNRNHLETWSASTVSFDNDTVYYDFTTSADKAYGSNQKQVAPGKFAIMVGDVNQDGVVDISDLVDMDSDLTNGTTGYIVYDLNGDGVVDISDLIVIDENLKNGAVSIIPE